MKIDLHVHTSERSPCGQVPEEEQISSAIGAGLDAIAITDHGRLVPADRLEYFNRQYAPFHIYGGIEISTDGEDFLVLGIQDAELELTAWTYPTLHAFVRAHDGFIVLAHPFRYHAKIPVDIKRYRPDAIETYSPNIPGDRQQDIRDLAQLLNMPMLSNSDSHSTDFFGAYYNLLHSHPRSEPVLFDALRNRDFRCWSLGSDYPS
jgi:predicted metal-dependent phosphoesterase TrpH